MHQFGLGGRSEGLMAPTPGESLRGQRTPILFLDLEGGFGGSSRSLFFMLESMDRATFSPVVVSRSYGPIAEQYIASGVPHYIIGIPDYRPSERNNWVTAVAYWNKSLRRNRLNARFKDIVDNHAIQILHCNHEGLAPFTNWLSSKLGLPWVCHVRTRMHASLWSRYLYRIINKDALRVIFITENELEHFARVCGPCFDSSKSVIINNPSGIDPSSIVPLESLANENAFRIICLGNYSPNRGTDLVPEVGGAVRARGGSPCRFHLFGRPAAGSILPWKRNRFINKLKKKVAAPKLGGSVVLEGHTASPERALAAGHMLLQVRRRANPWGREIIEAMTLGLPVVAVGTYQGVVQHGETGFLVPEFQPDLIADYIVRLRDDEDLRHQMGEAAAKRAARLFGQGTCSARMAAVYREVLNQSSHTPSLVSS